VCPRPKPRFAHGYVHRADGFLTIVAAYHPSRQNTNTGRLTPVMLRQVFERARALLAR
jgi:uracil-DNA glycosylase